jgi:biotin synthase
MIRVAVGTASVLGLADIKMKVAPQTAHLLTPGKCAYDCSFCTQALSSNADHKLLSRISWPEYDKTKVYSVLEEKQHQFQRVCLQVVISESDKGHLRYVKDIRSRIEIPFSVDLKTDDMDTVRQTFSCGADVVGLPIDCANPNVFSQVKDGSFSRQLDIISQAAAEFPYKISTHIIIGLGETERDSVLLIKKFYDLKVTLGLFAFTPVKGTAMEYKKSPKLDHFRRIQIAKYLIYNGLVPDFDFDEKGRIAGFGYEPAELYDIVSSRAFQTTGCSGCNRPYYNERPGGVMYNYPITLTSKEHKDAIMVALNKMEAGID